jgi:hypothetical protein
MDAPKWIPVLFGSVMLLMGLLILGALFGIIPTEEGGQFLAPPLVIASLGLGLVLGGILIWVPYRTPPMVRSILFLVALALVAVVCNWTAFAPNVAYYSSTSIGPVSITEEGGIGGRIAFGIAALVVDIVFISVLVSVLRPSKLAS